MKLLAFATHPIQYQAPLFRALATASGVHLTVAYALIPTAEQQGAGFGVPFSWDLDLLEGYRSIPLDLAGGARSIDRFVGLRALGLGGVLAREAPDAVLIPGWNSYVLVQALRAARWRRVPALVRCEANDLRRRPAVVRWLQARLLGHFQAALTIGWANRRFLRAQGMREETLFDAPYFVDNARFVGQARDLEPRRRELRARWGIGEEQLVALFAGKLIGKKRPLDLVRALDLARRAGAPVHLLVAGEGPLRDAAAALTAELGVPATFAGFLNQTEIGRAYVAADLLLLPSDAGETWGLVVNEAAACGRPAVVSDLVGCREDLILEGETGWSFPCGDVAALAERLCAAAAERRLLSAMGERARRLVVERYSVERAVEGTIRAAESVVRSRRR